MIKKRLIIIFIILFILIFAQSQDNNFKDNMIVLPGSNIYNRIFMFFFPISKSYQTFSNIANDKFDLEILMRNEDIRKEPATPPYFETDLFFRIKDIPLKNTGKKDLPITIRTNKKVLFKEVRFNIHIKENIIIIKGELYDLYIKEITDNDYFKNRFKWRYPIYFDIRIQLNNNLLNRKPL